MKANLKAFGNMSMFEANFDLKENLKEVKLHAEELLKYMDLTSGRCQLDPDEYKKWTQLRQSILEFRTLEISPVLIQSKESL